jgi:TorA maturation chaperone TorD
MDMGLPEAPNDERARADCYRLIANLFYGRADRRLLSQLAAEPQRAAKTSGGWRLEIVEDEPKATAYTRAFEALKAVCRELGEDAIRQEYEGLFLGDAQVRVSPLTSVYAAPAAPDRYLRALTEYLVSCGLVRSSASRPIEDHVSAVCDLMSWLIERKRPIAEQLAFFNEFVRTSLTPFCDALEARKAAHFYRAVAGLARAFIQQEIAALEQAEIAQLQ